MVDLDPDLLLLYEEAKVTDRPRPYRHLCSTLRTSFVICFYRKLRGARDDDVTAGGWQAKEELLELKNRERSASARARLGGRLSALRVSHRKSV